MFLSFVAIFIAVHIIFKHMRQILVWSCKLITTLFLWSIVWICTQLQNLPQWQQDFKDSVWNIVNMTKDRFEL